MGKLQIGPKDEGGEGETSKGKRATTTIQIPRELDLRVTEYATRMGISKAEAMDRLFRAIYPEGVTEAPGEAIAPGEDIEETIAPGTTPLTAPPGETDEILTGVAKDLRAINTIKQLNRAISNEGEESKGLTYKDIRDHEMELEKIRQWRGGGRGGEDSEDSKTSRVISALAAQVRALRSELGKHMEQDIATERDFYKNKLEEKEALEARQAELQPIQEQIALVSARLNKMVEEKEKKGDEGKPITSEQTQALIALQKSTDTLKLALEKMGKGEGEGGEGEKLGSLIDSLSTLVEKLMTFQAKFGGKKGEAGELDWRTVTVTTAGEVLQEAIGAVREIEAGKAEEGAEGEKPPASGELIERRVYNYAMKKIAAGQLNVDPYKAAEELGLTPNDVWNAIENLKKRGALVVKPPGGAETESRRAEKPETVAEGIIEPSA